MNVVIALRLTFFIYLLYIYIRKNNSNKKYINKNKL